MGRQYPTDSPDVAAISAEDIIKHADDDLIDQLDDTLLDAVAADINNQWFGNDDEETNQ